MGGYVVDKTRETGTFTLGSLFHIDRDIKKTAMETESSRTIQDFEKKIEYTIVKGVCTKTELQGTIEDNVCVPADAQYVTTIHYQMNDMIADSWRYNVVTPDMKVDATLSVERTKCIPFGLQGGAHTQEVTAIFSAGYVNTTSSIKDPSVFNVPAICDNSTIPIQKSDGMPGSQFMEALLSNMK